MIQHGSVPQVAKLTGFPVSRLRRLVKAGAIPSVKAGTKDIITVDAVLDWLNSASRSQARHKAEE